MRRLLLAVAVLAAAPRLYFAGVQHDRFLPWAEPDESYFEMACALVGHNVFSTGVPDTRPGAWRGPLFPVFGALTQAGASEPSPGRMRLGLALAGGAAAALAFALGAALVSPLGGALAALGVALEPASLLGSLDVHVFYGLVLLSLAAAAAWWARAPTAARSLLLGLAIGASLLVRGAHFPLPFLLLPLARRRWALLLGVALALLPMTVRNGLRFGLWSPLPDVHAGAVALLAAAAGEPDLESRTVERALELAESFEPGFGERWAQSPELHPQLLRLARQRIAEEPLLFAGRCLRRLAAFWWALALPAALALFGLWRAPSRPFLAAALVALSLSGYAVAGGGTDHRAAAWPLLLALAGAGLARPRPDGRYEAALPWGAAALGGVYAAFLCFLALETAGRPGREGFGLACVERAASASREPRRGRAFLAAARVDASRGQGCATAVPLLRAALADAPASAAPALAACGAPAWQEAERAAAGDRAALAELRRARALAAGDADAMLAAAGGDWSLRRRALRIRAAELEKQGKLFEAEQDLRHAGDLLGAAGLLARHGRRPAALRALRGSSDAAALSALWALSGGREGRLEEQAACGPGFPLDRALLPMAYFDRCLAARPGESSLWKDRGVARFLAGDRAGARADLAKALELAPGDEQARRSLHAVGD